MSRSDAAQQSPRQNKQKPDSKKNLLAYQDESKDGSQEYYDEEEEEYEDEVQEISGSGNVYTLGSASKNHQSAVDEKA